MLARTELGSGCGQICLDLVDVELTDWGRTRAHFVRVIPRLADVEERPPESTTL
jgi:hypothetical protein